MWLVKVLSLTRETTVVVRCATFPMSWDRGMSSSKTMLKHSTEYDSKFLAIRTDSQVIGELLDKQESS